MLLEDLRTELMALGPVGGSDLTGEAIEILDVVHDSRRAGPGSLFCAVPGLTVDGHDFIDAAVDNGAAALLVERLVESDRPQLVVDSVRQAMAYCAAAVHGHPSAELSVFGITGTNGKTTTTQLLASILRSAGLNCEVIGTLDGVHTTPESTDLQRKLRQAVTEGVDVVALEVSSHALDQHRADDVEFSVVAFSNLTADHLDYHLDMASYFEAKARLFDGRSHTAVINVDDSWGVQLAAAHPSAVTVSIQDLPLAEVTIAGSHFHWRGQAASVPLPGRMNVANAVMAAESARLLGVDEAMIIAGLASATLVPGRMELVAAVSPDQPTVVVDYSHTPDSIDRALATLRSVAPTSQISIVFGCGGDRDQSKRPLMARAAETGADRVFVTSDNPRSEDPDVIISQAVAGLEHPDAAIVEPDRRAAIDRAIGEAGPGDIVLVAGKGHEKTQTIGSNVFPFDDVLVSRQALEGKNL